MTISEVNIKSVILKYIKGEIDLICILGPTASGKTHLAVKTAEEINELIREDKDVIEQIKEAPEGTYRRFHNAEIISADSRQVYREMTIGTGKDLDEYNQIPYHLIDIIDAGEKYNIFRYQNDFEKAYKDIVTRGGIPILCGGSGLYIEAATCGYHLPEVPSNPELREELEAKSMDELILFLRDLKSTHNCSDFDSKKRIIRAIEIALFEKENPIVRSNYLPKETYYIGIDVDRDSRNKLIDKRLDNRLKEGLIEEVSSLISKGIPAEDLIYYGLEYKFITLHLIGELSLVQMKEKLSIAIHQFAKRQMTWFRGMEKKGKVIHWMR